MVKCDKCPNVDEFIVQCAGCGCNLCTECSKLCHDCESRDVCKDCNMNSQQHPRCTYCDTV